MPRRYIGPVVRVRIPLDVLATTDHRAAQLGVSRAEAIRRLLILATHSPKSSPPNESSTK